MQKGGGAQHPALVALGLESGVEDGRARPHDDARTHTEGMLLDGA